MNTFKKQQKGKKCNVEVVGSQLEYPLCRVREMFYSSLLVPEGKVSGTGEDIWLQEDGIRSGLDDVATFFIRLPTTC